MTTMMTKVAIEGARLFGTHRPSAARVDGLLAQAATEPGATLAKQVGLTAEPPPTAEPAAPPSDSDRLDAHDVTLAEHAARLATLERKASVDPGTDAEGAGAAAAVSTAWPTRLNAAAIYARMNGATQPPPMPATVTGADGRQVLDGRAILCRYNAHQAASAARAISSAAPVPGKPVPPGTPKLGANEIHARMNRNRVP